jgi:uncharacterized membrane protein HdeD (DUF308 family)
MLASLIKRMWWITLLRGILAILFGIVVLTMPGIALASLILVFGVYLVVDGVFTVVHAIQGRSETPRWWMMLLEGLIAIVLGVYALRTPGMAALALLFFIAAWAIVSGFLRVLLAIALRKEISGEWWMILGGIASVLFGVIMFARPGTGALALLTIIGFWSILAGIALVMLAFKARSFGKTLAAARPQPA